MYVSSINMLRAQAAIPARLVHVLKLYKYIYIYALLNTIERKKEKKKKRKKMNINEASRLESQPRSCESEVRRLLLVTAIGA